MGSAQMKLGALVGVLVLSAAVYGMLFTRFILRSRAVADAVTVFFKEDVVMIPDPSERINVNVFLQVPQGKKVSAGTVTLANSPELEYVQPMPRVEDTIEAVCLNNGFVMKELIDVVVDDVAGRVTMTRVAIERDEDLPSPQFCYSTFTYRVRQGQSLPADGAWIAFDERGKFEFMGPSGELGYQIDPNRNRVVVQVGAPAPTSATLDTTPTPTQAASSFPSPTSAALPPAASPTPAIGGFSCTSCPTHVGLGNIPLREACTASDAMFMELRQCIFNPQPGCERWDVSGDGVVNAGDMSALILCCNCVREPTPTGIMQSPIPTRPEIRLTPTPTPLPRPTGVQVCRPMQERCRQITVPYWYFDASANTCVQPLALCGGSRFRSKEECETSCITRKEPSPTGETLPPVTVPVTPAITITPQVCATRGSGDCNCDGKTNLVDFECWRSEFVSYAQTGACDPKADFDEDGACRLSDFEVLRSNFE